MSKVFEYFEELKEMGIDERDIRRKSVRDIDYIPPRQRKMNEADYDDMRYKEDVDDEAVERAKRYRNKP